MKNVIGLSTVALGLSALMLAAPAFAATISTQMDIGTRGSDVTTLQQTFAGDPSIYPQGLVTGYFGQLSSAAVKRFQANQGVVSSGSPSSTGYGRVGPMTIAKFNAVYGGVSTGGDTSAPIIASVAIVKNNNSASVSWTTNETATGIVYYSTSPLQLTESSNPHVGPGITGNFLSASASAGTSNSVSLTNLTPNTTYYYMIQTTDSSGNVSVVWPASFSTNQ